MNHDTKLRRAIRRSGQTRAAIASQCGMNPTYLDKIATGTRSVNPLRACKIAAAIGCDVDDLDVDDLFEVRSMVARV